MATFTKLKLSGSTDGKGVLVAATAIGSGTTIHTADASALDMITLFASNPHTADIVLTLGWGGTTDPDNLIVLTIPTKKGHVLVVTALPLTNSLVVKAAAGTGSKLGLYGYVDRIA